MIPSITIVYPNPVPTTGGSIAVYGDRFESGCQILYLSPVDVSEIGRTTPTWINAGQIRTINYPDQVDAPDGWWTRVQNPGGETSNIVRTTWVAEPPPEPEPCPEPPTTQPWTVEFVTVIDRSTEPVVVCEAAPS